MFLVVADETSIGYFFASQYRRFLFEVNGVGAVDLVANTLCESSKLVGEGCFPSVFIVALNQVEVLLGLTGDWVSDEIGFCNCDIIFCIRVPGRDGVWPTGVSASLVPWRPFHPWRWRVGLEVDARHPWR